MKRLLAAAAFTTLALTAAASGGHTRAAATRAAGTISSSRLVDGGNIRMTATIGTPVEVGAPLKITYRAKNVSNVTRKIRLTFSLWYVVRSPDGTTYDTRVAFRSISVPYVPSTKLRPGQTITSNGYVVRVRWPGPLRITPGWRNEALPTVRVGVKPSSAPTRRSAVAAVLAATGHLLGHCTPTKPGVAVTGRINAPKHSAPPLRARCSIRLHREPGFFRAQVLVASPRGLRVQTGGPYERVSYELKPGRNSTAVGWLFVVTRSGATSVDSTSVESTKNGRGMAPQWQWTTLGFQPQPGGSHCGGYGGGGGGYGGPLIEFVSKCR
jgi:hypothetical protein